MRVPEHIIHTPSRRRFLQSAGILGGMAATFPAWADTFIDLDLPGGPNRRELTTAFPQKAQMIAAAHPAALARDSLGGVRSRRIHPERPILRALALGGDSGDAWTWRRSDLPFAVTSTRRFLCRSLICWRCRGSSLWRSFNARAIPAGFSSRAWPGAEWRERGDGKCAVDRRPLARCAGSRGCQGRGCCGSIQRFGRSGRARQHPNS